MAEIVLICAACVVVILVCAATAVALALNKVIFARQDKNPDYKYYKIEDFNLETYDIPVTYRGINLYAKVYAVRQLEKCERVVIFQHGFGAGSSSYTNELASLARQGYAVVAADAYGCNNSGGKGVKGFYTGVENVIATYIAIKKDIRLKDKKLILVGHSWGAYSVCCAAARIKADGVVAISGFNAPVQCVCDQIKLVSQYGKLLVPIIAPVFYVINACLFGFKGNAHADRAIEKSGVKALLIHGERDKTVPVKHAVAAKAEGGNISSLILSDKKHNPYNTVAAEQKLAELRSCAAEDKEFLKQFDWAAATQEDEEVMKKINDFIQNV